MTEELFDIKGKNEVKDHYKQMPIFNNIKKPKPLIVATFKFRNEADYKKFHSLVKKYIYDDVRVFDGMQKKDAKTAWYPLDEKGSKYKYE